MVDMNAILVWRFEDAPLEFQGLSERGGDEDWLAFIPADVWDKHGRPAWMGEGGTQWGVYATDIHIVDSGVIAIGVH